MSENVYDYYEEMASELVSVANSLDGMARDAVEEAASEYLSMANGRTPH